jgi:putative heme-binding domain-containing protein
MRRELVAAILDSDLGPAYRAMIAVRPLALPEKAGPLRTVALKTSLNDGTRIAAMRALERGAPETEEVLIDVLGSNASLGVRRVAAELLGTATTSPAARAALVKAFASAHADIAMVVAVALTQSDAGAGELADLAANGRVNPALLRQRYVALALEKRPAELRARVAEITRNLPPEDARLDAVIAQRVAAANNYQPDPARGAPLFATHCATCHRFRDQGGNVGPSLDGIGSRPLSRLVEDILDPNRNVDPTFRVATLTLRSGETKSGFNLREEGGRVRLTDPATTQSFSVAKADIVSTTHAATSPMPAAFETLLPEQDFFDLIEYLRAPAK